ncbi:MAG: GH3 auxin-responsive promoter family protein, partial [Flavobacteriales bacterium]|nr:GH3 auxin-responsive promoter family protein [Flavobacteriales bacterium]
LSGIVNHQIPWYIKRNQLPSWQTNCIDDWEEKVAAIVNETAHRDMRLIGGIPSWVQMYFDKLIEKTGKQTIRDIFPNLQLYVYGGVSYEPYRQRFENTLGSQVQTIETYPASEGFIAFQDSQQEEGLLLQINAGIFYEFIPIQEVSSSNPRRIQLEEVETGVNYAIVLNTNAGRWGYLIGDTVRFVSKNPYRIVVTGRTKHYISAFGEHVIGEEVDYALQQAILFCPAEITEYHVAPQVSPLDGSLPFHEWFIEFNRQPSDIHLFAQKINEALMRKNIYYNDLLTGAVLQPIRITLIEQDGFRRYMKSEGKLGGQNKVPRLADNRNLADALKPYIQQ